MPSVNAMYTIDLLKGEGIPIRSRPGGIAMACLIVVVPLLLGLALTSFYMDCRVILAIQTEQLGKLQSSAGALSAALQQKGIARAAKSTGARSALGHQDRSQGVYPVVAGPDGPGREPVGHPGPDPSGGTTGHHAAQGAGKGRPRPEGGGQRPLPSDEGSASAASR